MNLIKQTLALTILCIYFIIKTVYLFQINPTNTSQNAEKPTTQKFMYMIGSGHGYYGTSCGNKAVLEADGRCFYEWIYNWEIRRYLANMLDSVGIKYQFVNTAIDSDLHITERSKKVNGIKSKLPKVYISIHGNASNMEKKGWEEVHGFEVYSPTEKHIIKGAYKNKKEFSDSIATWMAQEIQKELQKKGL